MISWHIFIISGIDIFTAPFLFVYLLYFRGQRHGAALLRQFGAVLYYNNVQKRTSAERHKAKKGMTKIKAVFWHEEAAKMAERHIEEIKGANIRELRTARGMSLEEFAGAISEKWGEPVAANTVGYWERGERMINSTAMMYISQALSCPYSAIYRGIDYRVAVMDTLEALMVELAALPGSERETLRRAAETFEGDKIALIKFVQLCILDLPPEMRREVLGMGIYMREQAEDAGVVAPAPADMQYILSEWEGLY